MTKRRIGIIGIVIAAAVSVSGCGSIENVTFSRAVDNVRITVNSHSYTIITAHKIIF